MFNAWKILRYFHIVDHMKRFILHFVSANIFLFLTTRILYHAIIPCFGLYAVTSLTRHHRSVLSNKNLLTVYLAFLLVFTLYNSRIVFVFSQFSKKCCQSRRYILNIFKLLKPDRIRQVFFIFYNAPIWQLYKIYI